MPNPILNKLRDRLIGFRFLNQGIILLFDVTASALSSFLVAFAIQYLLNVKLQNSDILLISVASLPISALAFFLFKIYRNIIRYSTLKDLRKICSAVLAKIIMMLPLLSFALSIPLKTAVIQIVFDAVLTAAALTSMRIIIILFYENICLQIPQNNSNLVIYGVSNLSVSLEKRIRNNGTYNIAGFCHDGPDLKSYRLLNLPIFHFDTEQEFTKIIKEFRIEGILFPDHESARQEKDRLIRYCETHRIKMLIAPQGDIFDTVKVSPQIRKINIEDLIGRQEIMFNLEEIAANFHGKTIMITGAAGSIGSELCRQMATLGIKKLILFDSAETPTHNIRLELEDSFPLLEMVPVIGDVRMKQRLKTVFERYRPQIVFHAAAYKHVPLMEENPCEAVHVNAVGTKNIADLCVEYGVEKMVMISTDKAVNPTNIMGASKRLAEIYVQSLGISIAEGYTKGKTKFITTRFGNVLGSNGSVIPRFMDQIQHGGPVTVTHPDITRFFMTIPEACRLVMEAATISEGNEILAFEMGESIKISDLAKRMIELAGFTPNVDIKIVYTGLRPGEKLYEEVLSTMENTIPTSHEKIKIAKVRKYPYEEALPLLNKFEKMAVSADVLGTVILMKKTIPEFISRNSYFEKIDKELEAIRNEQAEIKLRPSERTS